MIKYIDPRDGKTYTFAEAVAPPSTDKEGNPVAPGPAWGMGTPLSVASPNIGEGKIAMPVTFEPDQPADNA